MNFKSLLDSLGLKWRLTLGVSALLVASSAMLSIFLIGEFSDSATEGLKRRGSSLAKNLAYNAEFGVMLESAPELNSFISGILSEKDILFAEVYTKDGTLLAEGVKPGIKESEIGNASELLDLTKPVNMEGEEVLFRDCHLQDGKDHIEILSPVRSLKVNVSKEELGSATPQSEKASKSAEIIGWVRIAIGLDQTQQKVKETTQMIVMFTLLLVMLGILLSVTLVKMIASPINMLVEATEGIALGDMTHRVPVEGDQELRRLAHAFNTMCDSLAKTQRELELHNQNLETMIRERTRRLEEAQRQVIQAEKMAAVGQLAAGVAHELNNPLGGILGYAQFALEKIADGKLDANEVPSFNRYLADIELQARRCKMIVKNLLKFSRTSDNVQFELVDVTSTLEETFVFTSHQLGMKDIHLRKELQPDLPKILGNANSLQQIFTNIVINSMQSMPEGGHLIVRTSYDPPIGEFGGAVVITFQDTGSGIAEEHRSKIFEPFFTTKNVGEGTGLGLSVSYGIVKEHGGDIKVESIVGVGSTFTVVLPIVRETVEITA
jgi:two-component system NtrC family sensor kinase